MKKQKGFTLIEVLIALLIIGVALSAMIRSIHQSIRITDKVKSRMIAHWVALNALSEIQVGMARVPKTNEPVYGKANMVGQTWQWVARFNSKNTTKYAQQIDVKVQLRGKQIAALTGYVASISS